MYDLENMGENWEHYVSEPREYWNCVHVVLLKQRERAEHSSICNGIFIQLGDLRAIPLI